MTTSVYAPQKRYSDKQKERGLVKVTIWVPEADRIRMLKYCDKLRMKHDHMRALEAKARGAKARNGKSRDA